MTAPTPAAPYYRRRPSDVCTLVLPAPSGHPGADEAGNLRRWWYIEQPRPSVAFALQAKVFAAAGGALDFFLAAFSAHPDDAEDFAADKVTVGEALALETLRRARSGKALWDAESMVPCATRLWAVLHAAMKRQGSQRLDALLLVGDAERVQGGTPDDYRWTRPSLLHRLLLDCRIRYDGCGPKPKDALPAVLPPGSQDPEVLQRVALRDAVAVGGIGKFVEALDDIVVSADELALLSAWAVLHLLRPF